MNILEELKVKLQNLNNSGNENVLEELDGIKTHFMFTHILNMNKDNIDNLTRMGVVEMFCRGEIPNNIVRLHEIEDVIRSYNANYYADRNYRKDITKQIILVIYNLLKNPDELLTLDEFSPFHLGPHTIPIEKIAYDLNCVKNTEELYLAYKNLPNLISSREIRVVLLNVLTKRIGYGPIDYTLEFNSKEELEAELISSTDYIIDVCNTYKEKEGGIVEF